MHPFQAAVEARDFDAIDALLADDVVFTSPVAFTPYPGKAITAAILRGVLNVFEDFHYVQEFSSPDGLSHALMFETAVSGKKITGCDFVTCNEAGLITEIMVMVRPLSGAMALAEAMGAQFEQIKAEAARLSS